MTIYKNLLVLLIPLLATASSLLGTLPNADQLNNYGVVNAPNSDSLSTSFSSFYSSTIQPYIANNSTVVNGNPYYHFASQGGSVPVNVLVNPTSINITQDSSVRFYYESSLASYNNAFGVNMNGNFNVNPGDTSIVFDNKKSAPGSYVDLPTSLTKAGTALDLFLLADGGSKAGTNNIFWTGSAHNSDGISHVEIAQFTGTDYYLISWEDIPKGASDLDFNDYTIVAQIIPVPEPSTYLLLGSFLGLGLFVKNKSGFANSNS